MLSKCPLMSRKRKAGRAHTPSKRGSATPRRRCVRWLGGLLGALAVALLASLLAPPLRQRIWRPRLEWKLLATAGRSTSGVEEVALRKTYWVSCELVDRATGASETVKIDQPVYFLPVRFTARRGNLDIESCQFTRGDRWLDHLAGTPIFYHMRGDAVAEEELDEILQALLAHDLTTWAAKSRGRVSMPDMEHHLQRFRGLLDRVVALPVTLQQDDPVPFLLVCVPRLYTGDRDYLTGINELSACAQLDLYSRQQQALRRVSGEDFTIDLTTNRGQSIQIPARLQRLITPEQ